MSTIKQKIMKGTQANSVGQSSDRIKRKRKEIIRGETQTDCYVSLTRMHYTDTRIENVYQKSKIQKKNSEEDRETPEQEIRMETTFKKLKEMRKEFQKSADEIQILKDNMEKKEKKWQIEKQMLIARIEKFEDMMEKQEPQKKKNKMKIHIGNKPFKCNECNYHCVQKQHLVVHMRRHMKLKPYKCRKCKYRCRQPANLNYHMEKYHKTRK